MKKILLIILFSTNLLFGQEYFEGIITFKTEITTTEFASEKLQENLEYNYGDILKVFYKKNGSFIRKYLNTGEYGNNYQIYFNDTGELLITTKGNNKIDTLDVTKNSLKLIEKSIVNNKETIMDLKCDCIIYSSLNERKENVTLEFCYSSNVTELDPNRFQKHNDYFLNNYFSLSKRPYLKFRLKTKELELTFTATEITEKKLTENDLTEK
ncbi:MAG: hypothetical protein COB12_10960 [Flavobacterium sp.]|nr:MAG: hypothetical protein COB12_10960 [Flavobacterium sp.]